MLEKRLPIRLNLFRERLTLNESIVSKVPKQGTLFLIARPEGVLSGPPLAAKRHSLIKFPFDFKIGQENVMLEGNTFEGNITVTARWDLDGMPKASPDDIDGSITVNSGSKDVKIVLDHIIEAKKGSTNTVSYTHLTLPTILLV